MRISLNHQPALARRISGRRKKQRENHSRTTRLLFLAEASDGTGNRARETKGGSKGGEHGERAMDEKKRGEREREREKRNQRGKNQRGKKRARESKID